MGRVSANNFGLNVAREDPMMLGVAPATGWKALEPNSISTYGATTTTVTRSPISATRQRRKGTVTDLESSVEFEHDLTVDAFDEFVEGFIFARKSNADLDAVATAIQPSGYTVALPTDTDLNKTAAGTLIFVRGAANSVNNGLKALTSKATLTSFPVTAVVQAETTCRNFQ